MVKQNKNTATKAEETVTTEVVAANPLEAKVLELETLVAKLKTDVENKQALYLRALADYQNLERRSETEKNNEIRRRSIRVLSDFVSLKDDMDKAAEFDNSDGLALIKKKLTTILEKLGVTEVPLGEDFSPETMECVNMVDGETDNKVVAVHEKAYMFDGQLLKTAKVSVSRGKVASS
jgi:molecular chaperone GrpE